uniref:Histone H2A/H2B/H3 domain-containing protein n=1 Tax=Panagrolaimus sp. ES5 TaxID=591445 RepID=A0AC34G6T4_9BILA
MPPPGQRPQARMMYMTAPTSQAQQQQHMQMQQQQQQQQQTQRAMAMNQQQQRQQMMPNSQQQPQQHYYNIQPPRGMVPSPMKMPPQQLQIKQEGMRTPIHMTPPQMIIRGSAPSGYESIQSQVIIQQQPPQQQQQQQQIATSSSSQGFISRVPMNQSQTIQTRLHQPQTQLIPTSRGIRLVRPGDIEMQGQQYVIRSSAPPQGFSYVPSSSGEQQYIVQQSSNYVQAQGPGLTSVRAIRQIQTSQPQTPLRMALAQSNQQGNMVIQPGVVVIQSSNGGDGTPVILDQSTGNVIATSSNTPQQISIATTSTPIQIKQSPQVIQRPPITTVVPPVAQATPPKTTPSKTSSKKPTKKPAAKPGPSTQTPTPAPAAPVKVSEPPPTVLTPQSKLVQNSHLDSIIGTSRATDSFETSVKNAVNEFAETYAEFLLDELVDAARLRKVTKIENRDAKFVILRESNKEKDSEGKKK